MGKRVSVEVYSCFVLLSSFFPLPQCMRISTCQLILLQTHSLFLSLSLCYIHTLTHTHCQPLTHPHPHTHRYDIPLVADIHFAPAVALRVAEAFEKIRYADFSYRLEQKYYFESSSSMSFFHLYFLFLELIRVTLPMVLKVSRTKSTTPE